MDLIEATIEAVILRLRPIIMTSLAFILGVFSLTIARVAGAVARQTIGRTVIGGMLAATPGYFYSACFICSFYKDCLWEKEI